MNDPILQVREVRLWFLLMARGAAACVFGLVLMSNVRAPLRGVANVFLAYLIADCALSFFAARRAARAGKRRRELALISIADGLSAVAAAVFPAALPLRIIGGIRGVITGGLHARWSHRMEVSDLLTLGGVAAVGLGVLLLGWPGPGVTALTWLLGLEATVSGALSVAGSLSEIRRVGETIAPQAA
jgi:uncharacterized membrane protein HdeD (DUF308 family)